MCFIEQCLTLSTIAEERLLTSAKPEHALLCASQCDLVVSNEFTARRAACRFLTIRRDRPRSAHHLIRETSNSWFVFDGPHESNYAAEKPKGTLIDFAWHIRHAAPSKQNPFSAGSLEFCLGLAINGEETATLAVAGVRRICAPPSFTFCLLPFALCPLPYFGNPGAASTCCACHRWRRSCAAIRAKPEFSDILIHVLTGDTTLARRRSSPLACRRRSTNCTW